MGATSSRSEYLARSSVPGFHEGGASRRPHLFAPGFCSASAHGRSSSPRRECPVGDGAAATRRRAQVRAGRLQSLGCRGSGSRASGCRRFVLAHANPCAPQPRGQCCWSSVGGARRREPTVVCQQTLTVRSAQFGDRRRSTTTQSTRLPQPWHSARAGSPPRVILWSPKRSPALTRSRGKKRSRPVETRSQCRGDRAAIGPGLGARARGVQRRGRRTSPEGSMGRSDSVAGRIVMASTCRGYKLTAAWRTFRWMDRTTGHCKAPGTASVRRKRRHQDAGDEPD